MLHFVIEPTTGCAVWQGRRYGKYGRLSGHRGELAHRAAWRTWVGPIPPNHDIHHRCHNKLCIWPDHLLCLTRPMHMMVHWLEREALQIAEFRSAKYEWWLEGAFFNECGKAYGLYQPQWRATDAVEGDEENVG